MASIMCPSASMLRQSCLFATNPPLAAWNLARLQRKNGTMKIATFHTTSRREILTPLPQVVKGNVNEAAPVPPTSPTHGSYHWTFERLVTASLVPLTIAPFAGGSLNPVMDAVLCGALVIHSHMGFQALIIDYVPQHRLPKTRAFMKWGLRVATLTVAVGLYEFETNDVGVTEAIKRIWKA